MITMRAIQVHTYGDATQLHLEEIAQPVPGEGEVLVRVHASGVNALDWKIRSGMLKSVMPSTFPYVPGIELAGVVERMGPGVSTLRPAQAVFGHTMAGGTYAEYCLVPAQTLAPKPTALSFDEAATVPIGAIAAWQALFAEGQLQAGQRVLVLGGSGGVGLFAIQFAHQHGAQVITTTSTSNVAFVRSLGADVVIDYTQTRVEDEVHQVDLVLDTVGGEETASTLVTLKSGGALLTTAGQPDERQARALGVRTAFFSAHMGDTAQLLTTISRLIDERQLRTSIAATFELREVAEAQELSQRRHGRGRIILHIA